MAEREDIGLLEPLQSDVAPLNRPVLALLDAGVRVRCMRDPTRGGLATLLAEVAAARGLAIHVTEASIPVRPSVADCCELLGLDPLYVACEGQLVAVVEAGDKQRALDVLRDCGFERAAAIGNVREQPAGVAVLEGPLGGHRVLDLLSGEQLPRIC